MKAKKPLSIIFRRDFIFMIFIHFKLMHLENSFFSCSVPSLRFPGENKTITHTHTQRWSTVVRKPCSQLFICQFQIWFPHLILFRLKKIGWSFRSYLLISLLLLNINFLYKWDSLAMNRCQNFLSVHLKLLNEKISTINTCKLFSVFIKWKLLDYSFAKIFLSLKQCYFCLNVSTYSSGNLTLTIIRDF